jgi:E3 ubiquitin-protein ligase TRIP12
VASFASSILSSKDHPTLVIGALQLVDLLLAKVPVLYKPTFRREGVFHEIELLSGRSIVSAPKPTKDKEGKEKEKEKEASESPAPPDHADLPPPPAAAVASGTAPTIPGFKKLSSLSLEPEDAITLRARVIQFKFLSGDDKSAGDGSFGVLQRLVEQIGRDGSEKDAVEALHEMAELFGAPHSSVSSFELLQSGVVDGLLQFATDAERKCE